MSLTYTTWINQLSNLMVIGSTDANFQTFVPGCIDYAEQRLYRELNLVDTQITVTASASGARNPLVPVARDYLDLVYPANSAATGVPAFYARANSSTIIVGPVPDAGYNVEVVGTQRPTPLSSANPTTFLTVNLPDLFMAASMVFASGYMRDFGGQADNPGQSQSWENQYQVLFKSANGEEVRKKYESEGWTSQSPSPLATPPRV